MTLPPTENNAVVILWWLTWLPAVFNLVYYSCLCQYLFDRFVRKDFVSSSFLEITRFIYATNTLLYGISQNFSFDPEAERSTDPSETWCEIHARVFLFFVVVDAYSYCCHLYFKASITQSLLKQLGHEVDSIAGNKRVVIGVLIFVGTFVFILLQATLDTGKLLQKQDDSDIIICFEILDWVAYLGTLIFFLLECFLLYLFINPLRSIVHDPLSSPCPGDFATQLAKSVNILIKQHAYLGSLTIITSLGKYIIYAVRKPTALGYQLSPNLIFNLDFAINNFVFGKLTNGDLIYEKLSSCFHRESVDGSSSELDSTSFKRDPSTAMYRELSKIMEKKIEEAEIPVDVRRSLRLTMLWLEKESPSQWSSHLELSSMYSADSRSTSHPGEHLELVSAHASLRSLSSSHSKRSNHATPPIIIPENLPTPAFLNTPNESCRL